MDLIARVLDRWRSQDVRLNPGASPESLRRLQAALGVPLPGDVVAFFSAADGMAESETAEWLTRFWSIDQVVRSERLEREGRDRSGTFRDLAFADVMIGSWFLWFRTRPSGGLSVFVEGSGEECPSLTAALERYVATTEGQEW